MVCIYISSHSLKAEKLFPVIIYVNGIISPVVIMLSLIGPSSSVRQGSEEGIDFRLNGVTISADSYTFCSYTALNNIT